jgi:hypothetical protein
MLPILAGLDSDFVAVWNPPMAKTKGTATQGAAAALSPAGLSGRNVLRVAVAIGPMELAWWPPVPRATATSIS